MSVLVCWLIQPSVGWVCWLVGWLVGWLGRCSKQVFASLSELRLLLIGWLVGWLVGWMVGWLVSFLLYKTSIYIYVCLLVVQNYKMQHYLCDWVFIPAGFRHETRPTGSSLRDTPSWTKGAPSTSDFSSYTM